jgi:hypothetical protein
VFKIQLLFNVPLDTPIIYPKEDFEYVLTNKDKKKAIPGDPFCCVNAEAIKRTSGCLKVYFGRSMAWMLFQLPDGSLELHKRAVSEKDGQVAKQWDMTGDADVKHVTLRHFTPGRQPERVKEREQEKREEFKKLLKLGATVEEASEIQARKSRIKRKPKRRIAKPDDHLWRPTAQQYYEDHGARE